MTFEKYRNKDGTFKIWLHTWSLVGAGRSDYVCWVIAPLPWVWDEPLDGDFLQALAAVGYLDHCPGGWRTVDFKQLKPLYGVLHPAFSNAGLVAWVNNLHANNKPEHAKYLLIGV